MTEKTQNKYTTEMREVGFKFIKLCFESGLTPEQSLMVLIDLIETSSLAKERGIYIVKPKEL
jgi:hypothetical protein